MTRWSPCGALLYCRSRIKALEKMVLIPKALKQHAVSFSFPKPEPLSGAVVQGRAQGGPPQLACGGEWVSS